MKRLLSTLLLIIAPHVNAQFVAGQVLGAAQLNAALASPTITGGSINGAPIGQSNPKAVNATSVGVVGATSGTVSILPQSAAGTYNFNLPTTAGASGSVLTSGGGSSTPMTWTPQASLAVGSATVATQASTVLKSDNTAYYPMMGSAASNTNQGFNVSSGLSFNPTTGLGVTGSITASGNVFHNGAYTSFNGTGYIRGDDASYLRMQGGTSGHKWTDSGNVITLGTLSTTRLALSVPIDLVSGASNTYNSGASKWSYFSGPSNTYFTGSTGFYVNDQANTKNIFTVLDAAPNNALVVGTTGTSITGTLSATQDIETNRSVRFPTSYLGSASDYYLGRYLTNLIYNTPAGSGHIWSVANGDKMTLTASSLTTANSVGVSVLDTTDATSTTAASLKTAGGLGVAKKLYVGDRINVVPTTTTNSAFVAFSNAGGASNSYVGLDSSAAGLAVAYSLNLWNGSNTPIIFGVNNAEAMRLTPTALTLNPGVNLVTAADVIFGKTITAGGTTGNQTINKTTGRVNFAAAATSLVVTNSLATVNSICMVTKATHNAVMRLGACVAAAGSITIYADVAPDAETAVNFLLTN